MFSGVFREGIKRNIDLKIYPKSIYHLKMSYTDMKNKCKGHLIFLSSFTSLVNYLGKSSREINVSNLIGLAGFCNILFDVSRSVCTSQIGFLLTAYSNLIPFGVNEKYSRIHDGMIPCYVLCTKSYEWKHILKRLHSQFFPNNLWQIQIIFCCFQK